MDSLGSSDGIAPATRRAADVDTEEKASRYMSVALGAIAAVAAFFGSLIFGASFPAACVFSVLAGVSAAVFIYLKTKEIDSDNRRDQQFDKMKHDMEDRTAAVLEEAKTQRAEHQQEAREKFKRDRATRLAEEKRQRDELEQKYTSGEINEATYKSKLSVLEKLEQLGESTEQTLRVMNQHLLGFDPEEEE